MRILVVVQGFPPAAQGGSEIYAHSLARYLHDACNDEVHVLTRESVPGRPEYAVRHEQRDGLHVTWINHTFRDVASFAESYAPPPIDAIAAALIDEIEPDVAHVHHLTCLSTTIVDRLAGRRVPIVYTLHDYWLLCHRGQLLDVHARPCAGPEPHGCGSCLGAAAGGAAVYAGARVVRAVERRLPAVPARALRQAATAVRETFRAGDRGAAPAEAARRLAHMRAVMTRVDRFLAPSHSLRDRFIAFGLGPERIAHHRLGFDARRFATAARAPSPHLRIGYLGSLMVSKAPHVVLEAFARLPAGVATLDLYGHIVAYHGDDSYRERCQPLLDRPGVTHHGVVPHAAVPAAFAAMDVLVVPSVWPENSPLVIQEAQLAGVPVVASAIGGIPELVRDGENGLLFPPGDVAALTRHLERLVADPALRARLASAPPDVRALSDDATVTRALYAELIASRRHRQARRRLAAIVLSFGASDDTLLAVLSLRRSARPPDAIIVVDNDVAGDCERALAPVRREVRYLRTGANLGFPGGMNAGIRAALADGADLVLLVNSDVILPPDCVERLERTFLSTPAAGIVGPAVLSRSEPDVVSSLGMRYGVRSGRMRQEGAGMRLAGIASAAPRVVDGVSGCLALVGREVFDEVGLLDESYFFGFEDLELCLRARRAGFACVVDPRAAVFHEGGRSIGRTSPRRLYFAARNHLRLASHAQPSAGALARWLRTSSVLSLNVAHACRARGGTIATRLSAVARGARDYFAGRFGDGV